MKSLEIDQLLLARLRAEAFLGEYAHVLDSDRLEEWPDLFTDDARYRVVTRENHDQGLPLAVMSCEGRGMMRDRISALRTANVFEPHVYCHVTGALRVISTADDGIVAESTFLVMRTMVDGTMGVFACGRSRDRLVEEQATLRLAERIVILDSRQIDTLMVIPL